MDAILFDMDGVIVDSEQYWHEWERDFFPGIIEEDVPPDELLAGLTGINYRELYDVLAAEYSMKISKEEFVAGYNDRAETVYREKVSLMDGFHTLLEEVRESGVAVGLVSSSPWDWIDMVFDRFDLRESFDGVVSAEDYEGEGKPAPGIYRSAADQLDVAPAACVAVEDSDNGIEAAERAGMYCIGYRNDSGAADATVNGPAELREALRTALEGKGF